MLQTPWGKTVDVAFEMALEGEGEGGGGGQIGNNLESSTKGWISV